MDNQLQSYRFSLFNVFSYKPIHWVILHFIFAGLAGYVPVFAKIWGAFTLFYGVYDILKYRNHDNQAAYWACYYTGLEVLLRITRGNILHEIGKYAVFIFLILGFLIEVRKYPLRNSYFLMYLFCLIPSIFILELPDDVNTRKQILFNLSGPLSLFISSYYFSVKVFSKEEFMKMLWWLLLPIIATSFLLFFVTPDFDEVSFNGVSNFQTSGGFGPNQVSTILGFGIFLFMLAFFFKKTFTGSIIIDFLLLGHILFRALLTFSRGGIFAGVGCALLCLLVLLFYGKVKLKAEMIWGVLLAPVLFYGIWIISNDITGGLLQNRYENKNRFGQEKEDISSNRIEIFFEEIEAFQEYPFLGVGPGGGKYYRLSFGGKEASTHNELGRLLAEHGTFGIIAFLLLLFYPMKKFFQTDPYTKVVLIGFVTLTLLTFNHAAMRTAMTGFVYGFGLLTLNWKEDEE